MPIEIAVENLHKSFGGNHVLRGINLTIERGELVAIVGGSGCGKTVLLHLLIGDLTPDQGRVCIADHEAKGAPLVDIANLDDDRMDRLRSHWAVVFQQSALISGTVAENLALPLQWVKGLDDQTTRQRSMEALKAVGLNPDTTMDLQREELSGGMAKRVSIARALALEPLLIFFDEPTTGLDPVQAGLIQNLIFQTYENVNEGFKRTTLIITHDKDLLFRMQPRTIMLYEGGVLFDGSHADFMKSDSPAVKPYFNLMPVLQGRAIPGTSHR